MSKSTYSTKIPLSASSSLKLFLTELKGRYVLKIKGVNGYLFIKQTFGEGRGVLGPASGAGKAAENKGGKAPQDTAPSRWRDR